MKKLIVTLALIGMATLAFGQNLVLSGYLDSGVTVLANGADKAVLGLWGEDAGTNGGRVKLIGKYDNGDFGASFETRWDGLIGTNDLTKYVSASTPIPTPLPVYFKHAYAQAQFFDKILLTQVGMVKEESTKTGGNKNFKYASEVPGAVVVVKPIADLAIQAFLAPAVGTSSSLSESVGNFADTISAFSAAYTLKGVARAAAGVSLYSSKFNGYAPAKAYAGVNLYLVPNLTATVEGAMEGLNDGALKGTTSIVETLSYNFKDLGLPALTAGLVAYQIAYADDIKTTDGAAKSPKAIAQSMSQRIQPSVSYAFDGGITANLGLAYQSGAVVLTDGYTSDLGKTVGIPTAFKTNVNTNNLATFEVKPSVKLTLTKSQAFLVNYAFTTSIGADSVVFLTKNKDATAMQTFQACYTYSF